MCLVTALLGYLVICPRRLGDPCLSFRMDPHFLGRDWVSALSQVLAEVGLDVGHSFCIGAVDYSTKAKSARLTH